MEIKYIHNPNGLRLGYTKSNIIEKDGLFFKNLDKTGKLKPYDDCHTDAEGHTYDFSFGMSFTGVIDDERVKKYR